MCVNGIRFACIRFDFLSVSLFILLFSVLSVWCIAHSEMICAPKDGIFAVTYTFVCFEMDFRIYMYNVYALFPDSFKLNDFVLLLLLLLCISFFIFISRFPSLFELILSSFDRCVCVWGCWCSYIEILFQFQCIIIHVHGIAFLMNWMVISILMSMSNRILREKLPMQQKNILNGKNTKQNKLHKISAIFLDTF